MATVKRLWQALCLKWSGQEAGPGYFDPSASDYHTAAFTIEDRARLVG